MSKEFIQSSHNSAALNLAAEQQTQLSYFTESKIQSGSLSADYVREWAERNYQSSDYFLNFVKSIFKDDNFLLFTKYLRFPLPSAKLVKNKITPNLKRVLYAENATFDHSVLNVSKDEILKALGHENFSDELFYHLIFRHNDVLIEDINQEGKAYRYFLKIEDVKSVEVDKGKITKIAFNGTAVVDGETKAGIVYIDDKTYSVYSTDYVLLSNRPHNLGVCPADFISDVKFSNDPVVRESTFSFIREELEEFVFLKTLQKITEPNGAFPVITKLQADSEDQADTDTQGGPTTEYAMSSQQAQEYGTNPPQKGGGAMQAGTVIEVPAIEKSTDGTIDTNVVSNYVNFHYVPVDVLKNIDDRIKEISQSIVTTITGDVVNSNEAAKNESQILMGVSTLENKLTELAGQMGRIQTISDNNMLELQYPGRVEKVFVYYGSSFYLESIAELRRNFEDAKNPIERKDIIIQINQNKYKNNQGKKARQELLNEIMPYISDLDFDKALDQNVVSDYNKELQLRFNYWISAFEAEHGDILQFYLMLDGEQYERLALINNLLSELIKPVINENNSRTNPED